MDAVIYSLNWYGTKVFKIVSGVITCVEMLSKDWPLKKTCIADRTDRKKKKGSRVPHKITIANDAVEWISEINPLLCVMQRNDIPITGSRIEN